MYVNVACVESATTLANLLPLLRKLRVVTFSDPGKNMSPHRVTPLLCFKVPRSQSLLASHCCRSLTQLEYFQGMEAAPWHSQQIGMGLRG